MSLAAALPFAVAAVLALDAPETHSQGYRWFAEMAGSCWRGTTPDGKPTDIQCYRLQYGHFLRGSIEMLTTGHKAAGFQGEAIFVPASAGRIAFWYWGSDGKSGQSEGVWENDLLHFPQPAKSGKPAERTTWTRIDRDSIEVVRSRQEGSAWTPVLTVLYRRELPAVSAEDRGRQLERLRENREALLATVASLTPEQWSYTPGPTRWSVAECVEHIALAEDFIRGAAEAALNAAPSTPAATRVSDGEIASVTTDRSRRFQSPEPIVPVRLRPRPEVLKAFEESRGRTIALAANLPGDVRSRTAMHPLFKEIDAYQWIVFLSAHAERHLAQVREVMTSPGYPKSP